MPNWVRKDFSAQSDIKNRLWHKMQEAMRGDGDAEFVKPLMDDAVADVAAAGDLADSELIRRKLHRKIKQLEP